MRPTTLVAYRMNGDPLALKHGFPARTRSAPGMVGEKNVKWVTRIELLDHQTKQFYEKRGTGGPAFESIRPRGSILPISISRSNSPGSSLCAARLLEEIAGSAE